MKAMLIGLLVLGSFGVVGCDGSVEDESAVQSQDLGTNQAELVTGNCEVTLQNGQWTQTGYCISPSNFCARFNPTTFKCTVGQVQNKSGGCVVYSYDSNFCG